MWLACLAVEAGCGERVRFLSFFAVFLLKRFIGAVCGFWASDGDGAF